MADWAALPSPLLQNIVLLALHTPKSNHQPLHYKDFLLPGSPEAASAAAEQRALALLSLVCRQWRSAVDAALLCCSWAVTVQRTAATDLPQRLEHLVVASLDLRRLTWSERGGSASIEALLASQAFHRRSGSTLRRALGIPERLAPHLAAFPNLECVGLTEDYSSTEAKQHGASMQLAPLLGLQRLRCLQLELGIVDLAAIPPAVTALQLVEVDRLLLPPAPGASVADRLLAVTEALGLQQVVLETASGSLVFEEFNQAPMELEWSHLGRLLAAGCKQRLEHEHEHERELEREQRGGSSSGGSSSSSWRLEMDTHEDQQAQQQRFRLRLARRS